MYTETYEGVDSRLRSRSHSQRRRSVGHSRWGLFSGSEGKADETGIVQGCRLPASGHPSTSGNIWGHLRTSGDIRGHLGHSRTSGTSGNIWGHPGHLGKSGNI